LPGRVAGASLPIVLVVASAVALLVVGVAHLAHHRSGPAAAAPVGVHGGATSPVAGTPAAEPSAAPVRSAGTTGFPAWQADRWYPVGDRVSYAGHGYRCLQAHTSLPGWEPPNAPALWQLLSDS